MPCPIDDGEQKIADLILTLIVGSRLNFLDFLHDLGNGARLVRASRTRFGRRAFAALRRASERQARCDAGKRAVVLRRVAPFRGL